MYSYGLDESSDEDDVPIQIENGLDEDEAPPTQSLDLSDEMDYSIDNNSNIDNDNVNYDSEPLVETKPNNNLIPSLSVQPQRVQVMQTSFFHNDDNDDLVDSTPVDNVSIDHTPIDNVEDSNNNNDNDDNIEGINIVTTNNDNGNINDNNNKPLNKKSRTKNSSLIPDNQYVNLENMPKKRKRAPPQPFNPTLNNASLSSTSNVKSRCK